jgi:hypothetical protein
VADESKEYRSMKIDLNTIQGLRGIGRLMLQPPVDPATHRVATKLGSISLRQLQARHRFAPGQQPSLREIQRRWRVSEGSKAIHVLSFNTYLMNLTLNVFEVLDELLPGEDFFEAVVGAVAGFFEGGVAGALAGAMVGMKVSAAREALEESAGKLLAVPLKKPDVTERASEIGKMLVSQQFDLAVLTEVWAVAERLTLQTGTITAGGSVRGVAHGALPAEASAGSGLMTVGLTLDLGQHFFFPYANQGAADQDTDYYSRKGVLLVRLPLGFGEIDFYSTHLYYGNDIPEVPPVTSKPTVAQRMGRRILQLSQLQQIIQATHKPENVMVLCGDFNIDEHKQCDLLGFENLTAVTKELGLADEWPLQFPGAPVAHGGTSCALHPISADCVVDEDQGTDDCVTSSQTSSDQQPRIDYLFIERPTAKHTFNLDVTRIELLDFPREGNFASLSDHRGLTFSLLCSSKA